MENKRKYKIINKSFTKEEFNKYKKIIYDVIDYFYVKLSKNIKLKIIIDKMSNADNENIGGRVSAYGGKFTMWFYDEKIKLIEKRGEGVFYLIANHEFVHLHNILETINNNNCSFIPDKKCKTFEGAYKQFGFDFWTEVEAYSDCLNKYSDICVSVPTMFILMQKYKKLKIIYNQAIKKKDYNTRWKMLDNLIDRIYEFVYMYAIFFAALDTRKTKIKKYNNKILASEDFKKVWTFAYRLKNLQNKFSTGTYGKYQEKRLYDLGKYIIEKIFGEFNFYLDYDKNGKEVGIRYGKN